MPIYIYFTKSVLIWSSKLPLQLRRSNTINSKYSERWSIILSEYRTNGFVKSLQINDGNKVNAMAQSD